MAAELGDLLRRYREAGLKQSVKELGEQGGALIAKRALPKSLRRDEQPSPKRLSYPELQARVNSLPQDDPTAAIYADPVFQTVRLVREPKLDPAQTQEIDALGIPQFTRDILVRHGFSTFADVRRIADLGLLSYVYGIHEEMATLITEQLPKETHGQTPHNHQSSRRKRR
jgi:hypothetical protein